MMKLSRILASAAIAVALPASAMAAGGGGHVDDVSFSFEGPLGKYDQAQLQRGLQVYVEICKGCHGLKFVSFRSLTEESGPGYDPDMVKAIIAEAGFEAPDEEGEPGDTRPAKLSDKFPTVTGEGMGPDLSLMAKARAGFHGPWGLGINQFVNGTGGPEYIYSILTGYDGHEKEEAGSTFYGNHTFPGGWIAMSPPLAEDDAVEYQDGTPATRAQMAEDVSAFLMWAAEPKLHDRKAAGARNFLYIAFLAVLLYLTNKKLWAAVKKKKG